jgi:hypothetical protein
MTCDPRDPARHSVNSVHENDDGPIPRNPPMARNFNVDELIQLVAQRAGISPTQAALAIAEILSYLTARLPSPVVGRIREQLGEAQHPRHPDGGQGGVK